LAPLGYRFYQLTKDGPQSRDSISGSSQAPNYLFTLQAPPAVATIWADRPW